MSQPSLLRDRILFGILKDYLDLIEADAPQASVVCRYFDEQARESFRVTTKRLWNQAAAAEQAETELCRYLAQEQARNRLLRSVTATDVATKADQMLAQVKPTKETALLEYMEDLRAQQRPGARRLGTSQDQESVDQLVEALVGEKNCHDTAAIACAQRSENQARAERWLRNSGCRFSVGHAWDEFEQREVHKVRWDTVSIDGPQKTRDVPIRMVELFLNHKGIDPLQTCAPAAAEVFDLYQAVRQGGRQMATVFIPVQTSAFLGTGVYLVGSEYFRSSTGTSGCHLVAVATRTPAFHDTYQTVRDLARISAQDGMAFDEQPYISNSMCAWVHTAPVQSVSHMEEVLKRFALHLNEWRQDNVEQDDPVYSEGSNEGCSPLPASPLFHHIDAPLAPEGCPERFLRYFRVENEDF